MYKFLYPPLFTSPSISASASPNKAESGAQTAKRTSAMAGLVARFLPVVEAFFVANARDPKGAEVPKDDEETEV